MTPVTVIRGGGAIVLAQPHSGTFVPDEIKAQMTDAALELKDTDWRIPDLYRDLLPDATIVRANFSRYVIDANRSPSDEHLYAGQNTTTLVPTTTFDDKPLWQWPVSAKNIAGRLADFHRPYHSALAQELRRVKQNHGAVILYDCHSIRSELPFLFAGQLPVFNIGTFDGKACHALVADIAREVCSMDKHFTSIVNGRFKGGWTTRHYGRPETNVHAIQMEIAQRAYLESEAFPFKFSADKARPLRAVLGTLLAALSDLVVTKQILEN